MQPIVTIAVIFLEFVSVMAGLYIAYFIWLRWNGGETEHEPLSIDAMFIAASVLFAAVAGGTLYVAHDYAEAGKTLATAGILAAGFAITATLYFGYLRARWGDDRIKYAILLWATLWILIGFFILVAWRWGDLKLDDNAIQVINTAAQILGIVIAAAMIVLTNIVNAKQQNQTAQHKIYQTLELQSVQLFQWEIDHPKQVKQLWFSDKLPANEFDQYLLRQYVCQILNLFEMATRFRKEGIVAHEVYGSWVIWMWELCDLPVFQELWRGPGGIWTNYVSAFRDIMSTGVEISSPIAARGKKKPRLSDEEKEKIAQENCRKFFAAVSEKFNCEVVQSWLTNNEATERQAQAFAHRKRPGKPAKARRKAA